ncbi:MAG TPA: glycosyltransferase [Bryobacteraceae bacterium]|nr:glycosyltransferase [Bryobacteraceae bacterium]
MLRETDGFPIVYDCHDWLRGFSAMAGEIVAAEADSLRTADLVLFTSEQLRDRHCVSAKWMVSRNAVDLSHFRTVVSEPPGAPLVAGYVGALDAWFDIESLVEAARANPTCHFVIAGRIENPAIRELKPLPNVEFVGEVEYDQLPKLMASFRVGLIPFSVNELTIAVNPIKLYEYFSLGLPVVSSPLPEVQRMGGLVRLADNPASFAAEVRAALTEDDPRLRSERIRIAASESWASRAQDIAARFARLL